MTEWASIMRDLRAARGLTQSEAAERIGVSLSTLSKWESGVRCPKPPMQRLVVLELTAKKRKRK